jgi:HK97 gp10 family phage protein
MADDFQFNQSGFQELMRSPEMRQVLLDAVAPHIALAQQLAPKRTGLGAASIHSEPVLTDTGWEDDVSWTRERYYMYFQEKGTRYMRPHSFLVPAFEI